MMTRDKAIDNAISYFDSGDFLRDLQRRVRMETESQVASRKPVLQDYLSGELTPSVERLGFETRIVANPVEGGGPFLLAARIEDPALPTVL
jgi:hypothetical protein